MEAYAYFQSFRKICRCLIIASCCGNGSIRSHRSCRKKSSDRIRQVMPKCILFTTRLLWCIRVCSPKTASRSSRSVQPFLHGSRMTLRPPIINQAKATRAGRFIIILRVLQSLQIPAIRLRRHPLREVDSVRLQIF